MVQRNKVDELRVAHIADQISLLQREGFAIILVVSGAVACGYKFVKSKENTYDLERKAAAGIGQTILISVLQKIFAQKNIIVAQLLLTQKDIILDSDKKDIGNLLQLYIQLGFVAVINENDVLDLNSFGGNDYLATEVAVLVNSYRLLILSSYDRSFYGVGGGESKKKVVSFMREKNIKTNIVNGKSKNVILRAIL